MSVSQKVLKGLLSPLGLALIVAGGLVLFLASVQSKAQPPSADDSGTVRGKIERFTTAPRGEVDGAVLDDGTVLHWPPHMQDRFTAIIKEGDRVRATGRTETGPAGDTHFEAQGVTNLSTNAKAENPDFDDGSPSPGRYAAPSRYTDPEQRLRSLEIQVKRLQREVERLRHEK